MRGFVGHIKELLLRGALSFDFDIARVVDRVHDHATIGGASGSRIVGLDGLRQPITLGHQLLCAHALADEIVTHGVRSAL